MKREDLIDALEYIDDEFMQEADQTRNAEESTADPGNITPVRGRKGSLRGWGALAAGVAVFAIAAFAVSGVMQIRNKTVEVVQSAEAVRTEDTHEDQTAGSGTEKQSDMFAAEEQDVNALEEQTDGYASEKRAAMETASEEQAAARGATASEERAAAGGATASEEQAAARGATASEEQAAARGATASEEQAAARGATASEEQAAAEDTVASEGSPAEREETEAAATGAVRIRIISDAGEIRFVLNDTPAAESFADRLPLTTDTEPYGNNEIVFHPGEPLTVENGLEGGGTAGCIGYYAPWNNVVLYYGDFEKYPGLYILGEAVSGEENIKDIQGSITIELD